MTTNATEPRFGLFGKVIGSVLAVVPGIYGALAWIYVLTIAAEGHVTDELGVQFFSLGVFFWMSLWSIAVGIVHIVFGSKSKISRIMYIVSGVMLVGAIGTTTVSVIAAT